MVVCGRKWSKKVGNSQKWSEMVRNGQKWVVISDNGWTWSEVVWGSYIGVVRNCRDGSVVVGNDKKQPRLSSLINTHIAL